MKIFSVQRAIFQKIGQIQQTCKQMKIKLTTQIKAKAAEYNAEIPNQLKSKLCQSEIPQQNKMFKCLHCDCQFRDGRQLGGHTSRAHKKKDDQEKDGKEKKQKGSKQQQKQNQKPQDIHNASQTSCTKVPKKQKKIKKEKLIKQKRKNSKTNRQQSPLSESQYKPSQNSFSHPQSSFVNRQVSKQTNQQIKGYGKSSNNSGSLQVLYSQQNWDEDKQIKKVNKQKRIKKSQKKDKCRSINQDKKTNKRCSDRIDQGRQQQKYSRTNRKSNQSQEGRFEYSDNYGEYQPYRYEEQECIQYQNQAFKQSYPSYCQYYQQSYSSQRQDYRQEEDSSEKDQERILQKQQQLLSSHQPDDIYDSQSQ